MRSPSNLRLTAVAAAAVFALTTTSSDALPMLRDGKGALPQGGLGLLIQADAAKSRLKLDFKSSKISPERQKRISSALNTAHQKLMKDEAFLMPFDVVMLARFARYSSLRAACKLARSG